MADKRPEADSNLKSIRVVERPRVRYGRCPVCDRAFNVCKCDSKSASYVGRLLWEKDYADQSAV